MLNVIAGRIARVASRSTCRLTHYGRTTGSPHQVTIWFLPDGDHIYLSTMNMQRHWTRNVQANPRVALQIGDERLEGTARAVTSAEEMAHVARLMKRKYVLSRPYLWIKKRPDGAFRVELDAGNKAPSTSR
jgi:deazaflavin-dependent oxidoreductase (nitroreductase family)